VGRSFVVVAVEEVVVAAGGIIKESC